VRNCCFGVPKSKFTKLTLEGNVLHTFPSVFSVKSGASTTRNSAWEKQPRGKLIVIKIVVFVKIIPVVMQKQQTKPAEQFIQYPTV